MMISWLSTRNLYDKIENRLWKLDLNLENGIAECVNVLNQALDGIANRCIDCEYDCHPDFRKDCEYTEVPNAYEIETALQILCKKIIEVASKQEKTISLGTLSANYLVADNLRVLEHNLNDGIDKCINLIGRHVNDLDNGGEQDVVDITASIKSLCYKVAEVAMVLKQEEKNENENESR